MIPGPTMCDSEVLRSLSKPTLSHVSSKFIEIFSETLKGLKKVFLTEKGEMFIVAGSGTLAMEMAIVNTCETGDNVLILSNGYFGERFKEICERYQLNVDYIEVKQWGENIHPETVKEKLEKKDYKAVTLTHVDTSTSVSAPVKEIGEIVKDTDAIFIVDGVCATAGEEERMDEWHIDVLFTASQKAIGVPPGLAIIAFSQKALEIYQKRKEPVKSYFMDIGLWKPIMDAYLEGRPAYFATPPVNMIYALHESVKQILKEGMEERFKRHKIIAKAFREALKTLELKIVPVSEEYAASTVTGIYYPQGVTDEEFRKNMVENGVIVAGGLGKLKGKIFRVGHMGTVQPSDILATIAAIENSLIKCGYKVEPGSGLEAAQELFTKHRI
jgi:alanine-glyoxylate transaminase/serine-glyoxylate transaminase/serine-pyruvate transaminase